jgi:glutathione S-transferase
MSPILTAFAKSPDRGRGLARDMRVRWALEEVGQAYDVRLLSFAELKQPTHLARHPFGQIPTYEDGDLVLFESGAIVLHLAITRFGSGGVDGDTAPQRRPGLLPTDADARQRAIAWMFAALNTIEPPIVERSMAFLFEREQPWYAARGELLDARVHQRLGELSRHLGERTWLEDDFSAGDLLMVSVLLRLQGAGLIEGYPNLVDYIARATARPAYQRAFEAQRQVFMQAQEGPRP